MEIERILSGEFKLDEARVKAVIALIDAGNTIPFIARYRKEMTGSLDDQVLRELSERLIYLRQMDARREAIEKQLGEQGVLTDELREKLARCDTLAALEDLYRPFKPKRRTRASIARERGLEPLAQKILLQLPLAPDPEALAAAYVNPEKEVPDGACALAGARDIIAEWVADDAAVRGRVRLFAARTGVLTSQKVGEEDSVYRTYDDFSEGVARLPGHRILAINRGEREGFLKVAVEVAEERAEEMVSGAYVRGDGACAREVKRACVDAWQRLIEPAMARETRATLTERAQSAAIHVFAQNLRQLLMQPPVKGRVTLGVDPGFRTGCKLAVVDADGRVLETGVGFFTIPGQAQKRDAAKGQVREMMRRHGVTAVAIGNGTASREAEQFIAEVIREVPHARYMIVSEAGASVYSASKLAFEEFPAYDVSLRSAVSIARRMQDPLAELVKIDPKAIGVGQYQHDLKDAELTRALDGVVEACVNAVGVELPSASAALLEHVAGIGPALARNIVSYRDENGLASRAELKKVKGLGAKAFEQCAGFLRVSSAKNPLDATGVHPESYKAADALLKRLGYKKEQLARGGLSDILQKADEVGLDALAAELDVGAPTLRDILLELSKPGRDPRAELPPPLLRTDVLDMRDLAKGMELTGTVRNVIDFGAFVDIGVHQDGLVHVSHMADRFIRHPSEVVKVGDVVKVWVLEIDEKRGRIALTMVRP
ncbi:MAG: Tex family protein [Clostridia bacterium]